MRLHPILRPFFLYHGRRFLKLGMSGPVIAFFTFPGYFCPRTFVYDIGLNMSPSDLISNLYSQLCYSGSRHCNRLSLRCLVPWLTTCLLYVTPLGRVKCSFAVWYACTALNTSLTNNCARLFLWTYLHLTLTHLMRSDQNEKMFG